MHSLAVLLHRLTGETEAYGTLQQRGGEIAAQPKDPELFWIKP
jgi:hypothetical protein